MVYEWSLETTKRGDELRLFEDPADLCSIGKQSVFDFLIGKYSIGKQVFIFIKESKDTTSNSPLFLCSTIFCLFSIYSTLFFPLDVGEEIFGKTLTNVFIFKKNTKR